MTRPSDITGLLNWYTVSPRYCFSDSAGTVPCGNGDTVQVWKDRQGTTNLLQPSAPFRPTFRVSGNYAWLVFATNARQLDINAAWITAVPCSIAVWMRSRSFATAKQIVTAGVVNTGNNQFRVGTDTSGNPTCAAVNNTGTAGTATAGSSLSLEQWGHIVGTFTSGTVRAVYLNGGSKGTNNTNVTPTGGSMNYSRVGADLNGAGQHFLGDIGEVAIWSNVLSDGDVGSLFSSGLPLLNQSDGKSF